MTLPLCPQISGRVVYFVTECVACYVETFAILCNGKDLFYADFQGFICWFAFQSHSLSFVIGVTNPSSFRWYSIVSLVYKESRITAALKLCFRYGINTALLWNIILGCLPGLVFIFSRWEQFICDILSKGMLRQCSSTSVVLYGNSQWDKLSVLTLTARAANLRNIHTCKG